MRTFSLITLLCGVFLTAPSFASAMDVPPIKNGLWESTTKMDGQPPRTIKQCVDQATFSEMLQGAQKMMGGRCSAFEMKKSGSSYTSTFNCNLGPSTVKSTSEITGDFETEYTVTSNTTFTPPMMGNTGGQTVSSSRYLGPCPDGMKPGDMIAPDGQKVNVMDMMKQVPQMDDMYKNMEDMMKNMPQQPSR